MLIDKNISVKVSATNYKWYINKGYGPFNKNDIINIKIEDLSFGAGVKVNVKCDICGNERSMRNSDYNNNLKKQGLYVCFNCKEEKSKITNMSRYGCEYVLSNKEIQMKSKNTCVDKYGCENPSQSSLIKTKKENTCFKNHGVRHYTTTKEFKDISAKTCIDIYGVDNASKSDIIKNKKIETTLKNWGVENPMQSYDIFEKSQISGKKIGYHDNTKLKFRGTYEKDFLDHCYSNNIMVEKGPSIIYYHNGKKRYYHSDFYIPGKNLICEIKSDYYLNKYYDVNQSKKEYAIKNGYNFNFVVNKDYSKI